MDAKAKGKGDKKEGKLRLYGVAMPRKGARGIEGRYILSKVAYKSGAFISKVRNVNPPCFYPPAPKGGASLMGRRDNSTPFFTPYIIFLYPKGIKKRGGGG